MAKTGRARRERGSVELRGDSYRVKVYAGIDPLTGRRLYLTGSSTNLGEAERIRTRLLADADAKRGTKTQATLSAAIDDWLSGHEVEATTLAGYRGYIERTIRPALGAEPVKRIGVKVLEDLYRDLRRCSRRCRNGEPAVDHRTAVPHECREVRHRRRPGRPRAGDVHDCSAADCQVIECPPHQCHPMQASTIRQIHAILSAVLGAATRWGWIDSNPAEMARRPRQPVPKPDPPSTEEAARIIEEAARISPDWGVFVWLVFVTGMRRAEVIALRWSSFDLKARTVRISRNWVEIPGVGNREKDTKSHQERTIALDKETVKLLKQHRRDQESESARLGLQLQGECFVFSYSATRDSPYSPSGVTHKYTKMCTNLGMQSHLHALRHYSATELLSAGVDLRTVAGRLGHGGGGATTLRVYAKFVTEPDRQAAEILGRRAKRRTS
jgi:integrase